MSKVVLITGCSSGFGYVTAKYLAKKGYVAIPTVRRESDLSLLPNMELLDVTWPQEKIDTVIQKIITKYKKIDVLLNNAGYGHLGLISDLTDSDVQTQFATNFIGTFKVIKAVLPIMRNQKNGYIINVSSQLGLFSIPNHGLYSASKFAIDGLSQALRLEESKNGIKVVVINPGVFKTDFRLKTKIVSSVAQEIPDGSNPIFFARLVEKIITNPNPKGRCLIGEDWKIKLLLLLPHEWQYLALSRYFN